VAITLKPSKRACLYLLSWSMLYFLSASFFIKYLLAFLSRLEGYIIIFSAAAIFCSLSALSFFALLWL
jgi:hypothetical protein